MSARLDGGPAFPGSAYQRPGMTKREYFAGQFMRNVMQLNDHNINQHQAEQAARFACMAADALLAELSK